MEPLQFDPHAARDIMQDELDKLKARIIANMRAANEVASGRTIKSLAVRVSDERGTLVNTAQGVPFFEITETGRKAGKVPRRFYLIIYQWMLDKGIAAAPMPYKTNRPHKYDPQTRGNLSMAAAIAQHIKQSGTSLHRRGGRRDIYTQEVDITMKNIGDRLIFLVNRGFETIKLHMTKETIK